MEDTIHKVKVFVFGCDLEVWAVEKLSETEVLLKVRDAFDLTDMITLRKVFSDVAFRVEALPVQKFR